MIRRRKSLWQKIKENRAAQTISSILLPVLFGVLIIVLWQGQILHKFFNTDTNTLPLPSRICHIILNVCPVRTRKFSRYFVVVSLVKSLIFISICVSSMGVT